jgi:hypothetical protein
MTWKGSDMRRIIITVLMATVAFAQLAAALPEAFELGSQNADARPGGKEADSIAGDFILRNDAIEAVISSDAPRRKADMGTFWGAITPGCLYDLTLRGADNDQITIFSPSRQQGDVSHVRIISHGHDGLAAVETVVSAESNGGLYKRHEYRLRDGWHGVLILTAIENDSDEPKTIKTADVWKAVQRVGSVRGITFGGPVDPADRSGYAYGWIEDGPWVVPPSELTLQPGEGARYARFLAVGASPAAAFGVVASYRGDAVGTVVGSLADAGAPIRTGSVDVTVDEKTLRIYPDDDGLFELDLPVGSYEGDAIDIGRTTQRVTVDVTEGATAEVNIVMSPTSAVRLAITDAEGRSIPCKAQFIGIDGTESPNLGPTNRAHGCRDQYQSETGEFSVQVPPGDYRVIVTHGIEYTHIERVVHVAPGEKVDVAGELVRVVDTSGWVSTDFHNHSTPSGDNTCGTDDRIINLAAEHIEFAPTTEHNRLYDWQPHIEELGLTSHVSTVAGLELTGSGAHFNAFPFTPHPHEQDGGAPEWQKDPRLNAIVLRDFQGAMPERWVQINHPNMSADFIDRDGDGRADGGFWGLHQLIDAAETWGTGILADAPIYISTNREGVESVRHRREVIWLQMLNRGHRYWCVAVSDAHSVHGNGVGGWRTYVPSSTDAPAEIDWREIVENAKAGRMVITNGPFLEVETLDGAISGGAARASRSVGLRVKVQTTDWVDIDRVQVLVNGRKREDVNFTRAKNPDMFTEGVVSFEQEIDVPLSEDSHLIVVAYGEGFDLRTGYGSSSQSGLRPCAYTNPIYVDVDGGGFVPNGDTLGFPLPVGGMSVAEAKSLLGTQ